MKIIIYFFLSAISSLSLLAQNQFWQKDIEYNDINLRTPKALVLGELEVDAPSNGYAIVKFEGNVWSSIQDRIVLAASDFENWSSNDGNVGVKAYDSTHIINYFTHSRLYYIPKGLKKFYAVGQNFVDLGGNGRASIQGRLTVEYISLSNSSQIVRAQGNVIFPVLLSSTEKGIDSISIKNNEEGKLIVSVDGMSNGDLKEELALGSSLNGQWNQDSENITMTQNVSYDAQIFNYLKIYDVYPGTQNVRLLAKKIKGDSTYDRDGFYYNFNLQFIPNGKEEFIAYNQEITHELKKSDRNKTCGTLRITSKKKGKALVTFVGNCKSSIDDIVSLTLIDSTKGFSDSTKIFAQPSLSYNNQVFYQINSIIDLKEGQNSFQILGGYEPNSKGSGTASIYGNLVVKVISNDSSTGINDNEVNNTSNTIFPNPTTGLIQIVGNNNIDLNQVLIFNQSGKEIKSKNWNVTNEKSIDLSKLQDGIYFIKLRNENKIYKVIKNSSK